MLVAAKKESLQEMSSLGEKLELAFVVGLGREGCWLFVFIGFIRV